MGRMLTSNGRITRGVLLALSAGGACGLLLSVGCAASGGTRASNDDSKPVNTGLSNLDADSAPALPDRDALITPTRDEAMIRSQIEESARQLSVYFTNLELDGPPDTNETTPPPLSTRPENRADAQPGTNPDRSVEPSQAIANRREQPNPEVGSDDDGGVRVSLLNLAGGEADTPIDESGSTAATPDPDASNTQVADSAASEQPRELTDPAAPGAQGIDPQVRRDALARELAGILSSLIESGQNPGASALALASLETLVPDDTGSLVEAGVLSEPERASIDAVRSLLGSMTSEGEIASPDAVSNALETIKAELDAWAGLSIRHAALCTRVEGYGRYETFPSYRFIAGQEQEVIVYTELDRFTQQITMGPDGQPRYGIELSQRLELYHVADDLNTWNRAAEVLRDESRNRLRDYYLTNRVWLPGNLGVGRYHLKIVMRDLLGEKMAETIIPIEIVAR